jgi:hypothetical protein
VIICSDELRPVIEGSLPRELTDVVAAMVDADRGHAPADELAAAIAPVVERIERDRERDLIARIEYALGTAGAAATGLDQELSTLEQQRVQILLVGERATLKAGLCPDLRAAVDRRGAGVPARRHPPAEVDATERAVEAAASQSAQVVVARYDPAWLHQHGDIAALLRLVIAGPAHL